MSAGRCPNSVSITREILRFQSLNVYCPSVRPVRVLRQYTDFLELSEKCGTHPHRHRAEGPTHPSDDLTSRSKIQEMAARQELGVKRLLL
jgi:hypothetical protein